MRLPVWMQALLLVLPDFPLLLNLCAALHDALCVTLPHRVFEGVFVINTPNKVAPPFLFSETPFPLFQTPSFLFYSSF